MVHLLPVLHNSPEWDSVRRIFIGSSDGPVIAGLNPAYMGKARKTTDDLLREKWTGIQPPASEAMERSAYWGHINEPGIAELHFPKYIEALGGVVTAIGKPQYLFSSSNLSGATASPDYLWRDEDGVWRILEIKTTSESQNSSLKSGCPEHWKFQLYHQMNACEILQGGILALCGGNKPYYWDYTYGELETPEFRRVLTQDYDKFYYDLRTHQDSDWFRFSNETHKHWLENMVSGVNTLPLKLTKMMVGENTYKGYAGGYQVYSDPEVGYALMGG